MRSICKRRVRQRNLRRMLTESIRLVSCDGTSESKQEMRFLFVHRGRKEKDAKGYWMVLLTCPSLWTKVNLVGLWRPSWEYGYIEDWTMKKWRPCRRVDRMNLRRPFKDNRLDVWGQTWRVKHFYSKFTTNLKEREIHFRCWSLHIHLSCLGVVRKKNRLYL